MRNVVGRRIRALRRAQSPKVTQEELAARLQSLGVNIDRTAIAKIETGRRPVTDTEIVAICKVLRVKVAALFAGE